MLGIQRHGMVRQGLVIFLRREKEMKKDIYEDQNVRQVLLRLMDYHNRQALDAQLEREGSIRYSYYLGIINAHKDSMKHIRLLLTGEK